MPIEVNELPRNFLLQAVSVLIKNWAIKIKDPNIMESVQGFSDYIEDTPLGDRVGIDEYLTQEQLENIRKFIIENAEYFQLDGNENRDLG